jgi:hypothetical protein
MDRVHDVVCHLDELAVCVKRTKALCHKTSDSVCVIVQAEQVCHRGILGKNTRGDRLFADKLRHDVGERDGESAQVLPGWVRPQIDSELAL